LIRLDIELMLERFIERFVAIFFDQIVRQSSMEVVLN